MNQSSHTINRRTFLHQVLSTGVATLVGSQTLRALNANNKVNLACVGIGNRGWENIEKFHQTGLVNWVALCDTDMGAPHTLKALKLLPDVPRFQDFRKMFDQMGRQIDAVCVATPDFSHFPITLTAMSLGKAVYCEKPMGHSYRQIELMMAAEKKFRVATQMGNQGHSEANYFQFKTWTEAGIIKNVSRITAYMNSKRRWHGLKVSDFLPAQPVPSSLDWECWLATARAHAYNRGYVNGDWRSWYDFGNGALGDWGAHIFDTAHEFLQLGLPTEVETLKLDGWSSFLFPQASTLAFRFPARGSQPPCEITWYDGQENLPPLPPEMGEAVVDPNIPPPSKGQIDTKTRPPGKVIYGEGLTFSGGSHGSTLRILPSPQGQDLASHLPTVPPSPSNHYVNFLRAVRGEEKARSRFEVAGPLCQTMALGVIAQRVNAKLSFDPAIRQITNHPEANALLAGDPPRSDWEQYYKMV